MSSRGKFAAFLFEKMQLKKLIVGFPVTHTCNYNTVVFNFLLKVKVLEQTDILNILFSLFVGKKVHI